MASNPKKSTARVTPGQNAPVDRVFRLEDLLAQMRQRVAGPGRSRGKAPAGGAGETTTAMQLAAELESRIRDWRAAAAESAATPAPERPPDPARKTPRTRR